MASLHIFISWSGERSQRLATALRTWLVYVMHDLKVWVSADDIQAGTRWSHELAAILSQCRFGISCITRENQHAPWLMFEAGAISRTVGDARLVPLLLDLAPNELAQPLSQFQFVEAHRDGIRKLLESINAERDEPLPAELLGKLLDKWWPDLEQSIAQCRERPGPATPPARPDRELINEILQHVRSLTQSGRGAELPNIGIWIDSRPVFGEQGRRSDLYIPVNAPASALLDAVWSMLNDHAEMPPYRYGELWVLHNLRTDSAYTGIASRRHADGGIRERSTTPLGELGILDGDVLEVRRP